MASTSLDGAVQALEKMAAGVAPDPQSVLDALLALDSLRADNDVSVNTIETAQRILDESLSGDFVSALRIDAAKTATALAFLVKTLRRHPDDGVDR